MKPLIQERHDHNGSCLTVKVSRIMQKVEIYIENENLILHFLIRTEDTFLELMLTMNSGFY